MRFLSVCSGIEAASVAWAPLGWKAAAFSEIEPFPSAVLAHHYPDVPNLGDMTKFKDWPDDLSVDLLCGGTPCQSFSVAGLRAGLADPRGNLMLTYLAIAAKYRPQWLVWENVPGVLSSWSGDQPPSDLVEGQEWEAVETSDFGSFLAGLGELGYGFAYRVLDAQHFGVPQRRRRMFVVGCLGDWRAAAAVLFERHSLSGHPAPRRQAREGLAPSLAASAGKRGGVQREDGDGGLIAGTLQANGKAAGSATQQDAEQGLLVARAFGGGANCQATEVATALHAHPGGSRLDFQTETFIAHSLRGEGFDASEDGTGRGTPLVPVAFTQNSRSEVRVIGGGVVGALAAEPGAQQQNYIAAPVYVPEVAATMVARSSRGGGQTNSPGHQADGEVVAYSTKLHNTTSNNAGKIFEERTACLDANSPPPALLTAMQVRRLTPRECERLQGFPDDYTAVPHRGKPAADGPRYKALGNSWAVPCARWIGARIDAVDAITSQIDRRVAA